MESLLRGSHLCSTEGAVWLSKGTSLCIELLSCTVRAWSSLSLEAHEDKQISFTHLSILCWKLSHICLAGCHMSRCTSLAMQIRNKHLWKEYSYFQGKPKSRTCVQAYGTHAKPDVWEVCIKLTCLSMGEKEQSILIWNINDKMILVLMCKKKWMWKIVTFSKYAFFARQNRYFVFHLLCEVLGHQDHLCLLESQASIQDIKKINNPHSLLFFFSLGSYVKVVEASVSRLFRILGQQYSSV